MQQISAQTALEELRPEALQGGSLFGALSAEAIRFLLEQGKVYRARKDDVIFNCGDAGDSFFVVCKGSVDFFKQHLVSCHAMNFHKYRGSDRLSSLIGECRCVPVVPRSSRLP